MERSKEDRLTVRILVGSVALLCEIDEAILNLLLARSHVLDSW